MSHQKLKGNNPKLKNNDFPVVLQIASNEGNFRRNIEFR